MTCCWCGSPEFSTSNDSANLKLHPDSSVTGFTTPGCTAGSPEGVYTKTEDIAHEDVRCVHQPSCMKHIVANVCLHKKNKGYRKKSYLQVGIPDASITISGSDTPIKIARLSVSTKVKLFHSVPLLVPARPHPTTSITSWPRDSFFASKHSGTTLVITCFSSTISANGLGYNRGCIIDATSPTLEYISAEGEVTFPRPKSDILQ